MLLKLLYFYSLIVMIIAAGWYGYSYLFLNATQYIVDAIIYIPVVVYLLLKLRK